MNFGDYINELSLKNGKHKLKYQNKIKNGSIDGNIDEYLKVLDQDLIDELDKLKIKYEIKSNNGRHSISLYPSYNSTIKICDVMIGSGGIQLIMNLYSKAEIEDILSLVKIISKNLKLF